MSITSARSARVPYTQGAGFTAAGIVLAATAYLVLFTETGPWLRGIPALLLLLWAPGYALLRFVYGDTDDGEPVKLWAGPLALSPILSTALYVVARLAGVSAALAPWLPVAFALPLLLLPARTGRRDEPAAAGDPVASTDPERARLILVTAALLLLVTLLFVLNPWLRWRADGRFHIGVTAELLRGAMPPTDPFFAGLSLQYMWFFHATLAMLRAMSGASASALLVVSNLVALAAFAGLTWQFVRGLGGSARGALLALLVTLFGMGGMGYLFVPVKLAGAFTGADRGWDAVKGVFDLWPLSIARASAFFVLWKDQAFFLRKFLVGTAMSFTLAAFMLHAEASRRAAFGGGAATFGLVVLAAAGAVVLHPMMGIPAVAVVCALAVVLAVWCRVRAVDGALSAGRAAALIGANLLGTALALPYLRLVTAGKEGGGGFPISFLPSKIISLTALSVGVGLVAVPWLWRALRARRPSLGTLWLAGYALFMVGFALIVRFPLEAENIDKPTLLTHLPLALIVGLALGNAWEAAHGLKRGRIRIYLLLLLLPSNLLFLPAYLAERDPRTYRPHEKQAFAWIAENTPADAIVFDSQDRDRPGVEIQRRMYWSHEQYAATHEYPKAEMDRRRGLRDALYGVAGPDSTAVAHLRALLAPVYVIVRAGAAVPGPGFPPGSGATTGSFARGDRDPLAVLGTFERLYETDDVRVYRVRP